MTVYEDAFAALKRLRSGDRGWFWLCLDVPVGVPPLLVTRIADDPGMQSLRTMASAQPLPAGTRSLSGIVTVDADGQLQLGGPGLAYSDLLRLAAWACESVESHPALARLRGLSMLRIEGGSVVEHLTDPFAWAGLPEVATPGSMEATAQRLQKLSPQQDVWFWASNAGPGGEPYLAVGRKKKDPDGAAFARQVGLLRRQAPADGANIIGTARAGSDGAITLVTDGDLSVLADVVELLAFEYRELDFLGRSRLLRLGDGDGDGTTLLVLPRAALAASEPEGDTVDLSAQARVLEGLTEDSQLWFWFTTADAGGAPMLILAADRGALKDAARSVGGDGESLRGQVEISRKGWLHFQARQDAPAFVTRLAGWVGQYHAAWPALARLRGARLTVTDRDGETIARHKDDAAWTKALD